MREKLKVFNNMSRNKSDKSNFSDGGTLHFGSGVQSPNPCRRVKISDGSGFVVPGGESGLPSAKEFNGEHYPFTTFHYLRLERRYAFVMPGCRNSRHKLPGAIS